MWKRKVISVGIVLVVLGMGPYFFWNPLPLEGLRARFQLWKAGVHAFESPTGARGLHWGGCVENCQCVALIHGLGDDPTTWRRVLMHGTQWMKPQSEMTYAIDLASVSNLDDPKSLVARSMAKKIIDWARGEKACTKWVAVGNSFGGAIAAWTAIEWPEGIRRLLLASPSGLKEMQSKIPPELDPKRWTSGDVEALKLFQKKAYYRPRELPEAVWEAAAARIATGPAPKILEANQKFGESLDTYLGSIRIPTIVFWGKADGILDISYARVFGVMIQGATIREANECGHLPQKECPEALMIAIRDLMSAGTF